MQKYLKVDHNILIPDRRDQPMNHPHTTTSDIVGNIEERKSYLCQESHYSRNKNMQNK